ncbi:MAG: glycoside hydrolase family 5 protein [Bryobacter sp.]|nr:glycoside hydrolase family 5 protein [Bryobacter sp.]
MLTRRHFSSLLGAVPALAATPADPFPLRRGTNISHWLSQSRRRGEERRAWFRRADVAFLAGLGLDHLRIPVDEEQLFTEAGAPDPEAFQLLNNALNWCDEFSLRAIVDLHILRSHHFNASEKPLWTQPAAQERFFDCWRQISSQLKRRSPLKVAYELMNEPVADDPEQWNSLVGKCAKVVRELEPERRLVIGSNRWQSVDTFDALRVPAGDPFLILSFHYYHPMVLTHYQASWTKVGEYKGPVTYPGRLVPEDAHKAQPEALQKAMSPQRIVFDRSTTETMLAQPLAASRRLGLPLYCGEWGCIDRAPMESRVRWFRDVRSVFEAHQIAWTTWDYKGGFGLLKDNEPVKPVIEALGLRV